LKKFFVLIWFSPKENASWSVFWSCFQYGNYDTWDRKFAESFDKEEMTPFRNWDLKMRIILLTLFVGRSISERFSRKHRSHHYLNVHLGKKVFVSLNVFLYSCLNGFHEL
jgi:hypothetical protein